VDLIEQMVNVVKIPGIRKWIKSEYRLSNFIAKVEVINGRIYFEPFNVVLNNHPFEFSGSYGLDGSLDYLVETEFNPASMGSLANVGLALLFGNSYNPEKVMEIDFKISGDRTKPKVKLLDLRPKDSHHDGDNPIELAKKEAKRNKDLEKKNQEAELKRLKEQIRKQIRAETERKRKQH